MGHKIFSFVFIACHVIYGVFIVMFAFYNSAIPNVPMCMSSLGCERWHTAYNDKLSEQEFLLVCQQPNTTCVGSHRCCDFCAHLFTQHTTATRPPEVTNTTVLGNQINVIDRVMIGVFCAICMQVAATVCIVFIIAVNRYFQSISKDLLLGYIAERDNNQLMPTLSHIHKRHRPLASLRHTFTSQSCQVALLVTGITCVLALQFGAAITIVGVALEWTPNVKDCMVVTVLAADIVILTLLHAAMIASTFVQRYKDINCHNRQIGKGYTVKYGCAKLACSCVRLVLNKIAYIAFVILILCLVCFGAFRALQHRIKQHALHTIDNIL